MKTARILAIITVAVAAMVMFTIVSAAANAKSAAAEKTVAIDNYLITTKGSQTSVVKIDKKLGYKIGSFNDGVAWFESDSKYGIIDKTSKVILKPTYTFGLNKVGEFNDGVSVIIDNNRVYGIIDKTGKVILKPKYDYIGTFNDGVAVFSGKDKFGYDKQGIISKTGKVILKPTYYKIYAFNDGVAVFCKDKPGGYDIYGIIDKTGKVILEPTYDNMGSYDFDSTHTFNDGVIAFKGGAFATSRGGVYVYGIIDKTGKVILKPTYSYIGEFNDGVAMFYDYDERECGIISKTGEVIFTYKSPYSNPYSHMSDFNGGVAAFEGKDKNGGSSYGGIVDKTGKVIFKSEYGKISDFNDGIAMLTYHPNYVFIDKTGKVILKRKYTEGDSYNNATNYGNGVVSVNCEANGRRKKIFRYVDGKMKLIKDYRTDK